MHLLHFSFLGVVPIIMRDTIHLDIITPHHIQQLEYLSLVTLIHTTMVYLFTIMAVSTIMAGIIKMVTIITVIADSIVDITIITDIDTTMDVAIVL